MQHELPHLSAWITVSQLAAAEQTTRRQVYSQIDRGMPHSRIGDRIRVRRQDWYAWHEAHMVGTVAGGQ